MADISCLTLLRNSTGDALRLLLEAEKGDLDAMYAMGVIYAEGRGVPPDEPRAFMWLSLAGDRGDRDALLLRNVIAVQMNDEQFVAARQLLAERRQRKPAPASVVDGFCASGAALRTH